MGHYVKNCCEQAFRLIDKDDTGYISVNDFKNILRTSSNPISQRNSRTPSKSYDTFDNAECSSTADDINSRSTSHALIDSEQRAVMELQHKAELESNLSRMIAEVDVDGDGRISYSEFLFAMAEMPKNNNFVPLSKREVENNESIDEMHRQRHLARASSDGNIVHSYKTQTPAKPSEISTKTKSESGGIFANVFRRKYSHDLANSKTSAPSSQNPTKSSSSYFSKNRVKSKVHVDISWASSDSHEPESPHPRSPVPQRVRRLSR